MRICCLVWSLQGGGAERVMASLASRWAGDGHNVTLVTFGASRESYAVGPEVRRLELDLMRQSGTLAEAVAASLWRVRALRRTFQSLAPDVIVSFQVQANVLAIVASRTLRIPVVVAERVYPPAHRIPVRWRVLRYLMYRFAQAVVVQTDASRRWALALVRADRIHVIPNSVGPPFVASFGGAAHADPVVLAVGRLVPQKGFDVLIQAFCAAARTHPEWSLTLVGEGPQRGALERLAATLSSNGRVTFAGFVPNPEHLYRSAAIFVLSSHFEGFPNVLLEAMACGCAVLATDCPTGPSEIIRPGVDGLLVPVGDADAMARGINGLMADAAERERLGRAARAIVDRFGPARIGPLWDEVLTRVIR